MSKDLMQQSGELKRKLEDLSERLAALAGPLAVEEKMRRVEDLDAMAQSEGFWEDAERASAVQQERSKLIKVLEQFQNARAIADDSIELLAMVEDDAESLQAIALEVETLDNLVRAMEMRRMFSGEQDDCDAIIELSAGAGGVEACDWTEMLVRMYVRFAERNGFSVELVDKRAGEEAGTKSATLIVRGDLAYGSLRSEQGVHRLVRISPFDSNARRHTSFSAVAVTPEIDDSIEIEVKKEDLRVETMRAGGAGGQHVNKTDSAVRFTHLPTGISVHCAQERSQQKNRNLAMKLLKSKLYELELRKQMAEKDKLEAAKMENSFGSQIRNYVMAPYRLVKDLRTSHETSQVDNVLDGELQPFIEAYLLNQAAS